MSNRDKKIRKVLVVGIDATSVSFSASRAGLEVFAVDFFGDLDLKKYCRSSSSLRELGLLSNLKDLFSEEKMRSLVKIADRVVEEQGIDGVLLASGLEDFPDVLAELQDFSEILGNSAEAIRRARDWESLFRDFRRLGVRFPETGIVQTLKGAKRAAKDIGYPIVLKPSKGSGGVRISRVKSARELEENYQRNAMGNEEVLIQEYVEGVDASASIISTGNKSKVLCLTEQVIGDRRLGQREPFGWCGNIVPLDVSNERAQASIDSVKLVVEDLDLVGSNGVDFILPDSGLPYIVEVNPRFQETIECVERYLDTNVVENHLDACMRNELPQECKKGERFWTRLVLFASERVRVEDIPDEEGVRNVPPERMIIGRGEPICSVVASGKDRNTSLVNGYKKVENVKRFLLAL